MKRKEDTKKEKTLFQIEEFEEEEYIQKNQIEEIEKLSREAGIKINDFLREQLGKQFLDKITKEEAEKLKSALSDFIRQGIQRERELTEEVKEKKEAEQVGIVSAKGKEYDVYREEEGVFTVVNTKEDRRYTVNPSQYICNCDGYVYNKKCLHLTSEEFSDFWKKMGEYKEEKIIKTIPEGGITERSTAMIIKSILRENPNKEDVILRIPQKGGGMTEMMKADVIIALGNYLGIKLNPDMPKNEIKTIETNGESIMVVETEVKVSFTHPITHQEIIGSAKNLQRINIEDLKGGKGSRGGDLAIRASESKCLRKAILRVLPITHSGLLSEIKATYGWD